MKQIVFILLLFVSLGNTCLAQRRIQVYVNSSQPAQLVASAGVDVDLSGGAVVLGGTPSAVGGLTPYFYQWQPETGLDDASSANPSFTGSGPQNFVLIVSDQRGCSASDTMSIVIAGLPELKGDDGFLVYPNPGQGVIKLKFNKAHQAANQPVTLYNALGQLVKSSNWGNSEEILIDVTNLDAGNYTLVVGEGTTKISRSILIKK
jgi:hypothetical protein